MNAHVDIISVSIDSLAFRWSSMQLSLSLSLHVHSYEYWHGSEEGGGASRHGTALVQPQAVVRCESGWKAPVQLRALGFLGQVSHITIRLYTELRNLTYLILSYLILSD